MRVCSADCNLLQFFLPRRTMNGPEKAIANTWDGYANESSVHGIRFTSPGFSRKRRWTWGVLIVTFFSILMSSFISTVVEYFQFEVNTIVTMVTEPRTKFPAVTFCNFNTLRKSKFIKESKDPRYAQMLTLAKVLAVMDFEGVPENVTTPNVSGKKIRDMYMYFGHTMERFEDGGMLINCTYEKMPCNSSFFKPVITNLGKCYSFNVGDAFSKSGTKRDLLTASQPGSGFGLGLRLDIQSHEYLLMPTQEFSVGMKILVHDQEELPLVPDYGFAISPGAHTFVAVMKQKVKNLEPPYKTQCRKKRMRTGNKYSTKGCLRMCEEDYIFKKCGCHSPLTFMNVEPDQLCDLKKSISCAIPAHDSFKDHTSTCVCPEPCESVEYTPSLSYAYFPSDVFAIELANHMVRLGYSSSNQSTLSYIRNNLIELDIFFQQLNHIVVKQTPKRTVRDIYSELGGLLGASLGASFLTFIELIDFLCTKIARRIAMNRGERVDPQSIYKEELIDS